ncbi:MAG: RNA-binding S4 domain-containing protein [Gammaproteobacteria bacterium]|nr:RNA-binding S4 domain-containing protein [Gammaproteobacteria bacterium]MDH4256040.1 RNA-binding S4 domain-containing protein [Gammaproteobacteria bacterium]MDH5310701.1 RNA-binding S4 domain-containing protein [Gammaproteobacteria bacterium]
MNDESDGRQRVDKWLWYARIFRSRGLATQAVNAGHVRVNGERIKPGHRIRPGDVLEVLKDRLPFTLEVLALPERRGPAALARDCYREAAEAARRRQRIADGLRADRMQMPRTAGRPDKHTRRKLRHRNRGADTN